MDDATVLKAFGGEVRKFRLDLGSWEMVQPDEDSGPHYLEIMWRSMRGTPTQMKAILKYGLIGGGMAEAEAIALVDRVIRAGYITRYYDLAHTVLVKFLGPDDEDGDARGKDGLPAAADIPSEHAANFLSAE